MESGFACGLLAAALLYSPGASEAQVKWKAVGMMLQKFGEVVAVGEGSDSSQVAAFSVLQEGMRLRFETNARAKLVHDKERITYEISGPAVITVLQTGLNVEPASAVLSRTSAKLPVEIAAPGAARGPTQQRNIQRGGESIDSTRAGLASSKQAESVKLYKGERGEGLNSVRAPPATEAEAAARREAARRARSEREAQNHAEAAAKAIGKPAAEMVRAQSADTARRASESRKPSEPVQVAAVSPSVVATPGAAPVPVAPNVPVPKAGASDTDAMYQQALAMERDGKAAEAVRIYRRAARAGHGKSAKRLGDIFDRGVPGVSRDFAESLQWYQLARDLGETVEVVGKR